MGPFLMLTHSFGFPELPPTLEALPSCPPNKVYSAADLPLDQNKAMLGPEPRTPSVGQSGRSQELCFTYPGCGAQVRLSLSGQEWPWSHGLL